MTSPLDPSLIEEFSSLLANEGIRDVSHWVLPNDDVPFNEEAALAEFSARLDAAFATTTAAMNSISGTNAAPGNVVTNAAVTRKA